MTAGRPLSRVISQYAAIAVAGYGIVIALLAFITWSAVDKIIDHRAAVAAASALLQELEMRGQKSAGSAGITAGPVPAGSPFLLEQTLTVAGASLLQRVANGITKLGGNVLSSQVNLQGGQSKDGFVSLIASCEISEPGLQSLLYDLEAGMPFLFIDELNVQAPVGSAEDTVKRLRVLVTVSGQWQSKN